MEVTRPRFTIRRLMVVMAISAVGIWGWTHFSQAGPFEWILLSQIGGVLIAWGLIIILIGSLPRCSDGSVLLVERKCQSVLDLSRNPGERTSMKALEVRRNGELVATAGIGDDGVLSAIVTWVGGQSPRPPEGQWHFHVGGADSRTDEHVDWPTPSIGVGDEITIRIIEADPDQISPEGGRKVVDTYAMGVEMQRRLNSSGG